MKRRWLKWIVTVCIIPLGVWASLDLGRLLYSPMVVSKTESTIVIVDKNTSASSFVQMLKARGFIQSPRLLLWLIRMQGLSQQLKAGVYKIEAGETAKQLLSQVAGGDVLKISLRIIDGTTQSQVTTTLESAKYLTYRASDWSVIAGSFASAEGLLLADTYLYNAGSQSIEVLEHAHKSLLKFLEDQWQHRSPDLPYKNSYELLIAASIIEKESAIAEERRLISGVIVNRLHKHMPLQMDPTVIYALGTRYKGKLTREDLHFDSPYNTYLYRGLPPTPIAMVGKEAINAAAHPLATNFLYFVATGDGRHVFSVNYDQQKQAVARYRGTK